MTRGTDFIALCLLLVASAASAQQTQPTCDTEEHRQFDFWIGEWAVETPDGQPAGENTIEKVLNGCVLTENWRGAQGSKGKSFNMFYSRDGRWHQTWVDNAGGRLDLSGGLDDRGRMVLSGEALGRDGDAVVHEIAWTPLADGTVEQHWRASRDGGQSWTDLFRGIYSPK